MVSRIDLITNQYGVDVPISLKNETKRKLWLIFKVTLLVSSFASIFAQVQAGRPNWASFISGAVDGMLIASMVSTYTTFVAWGSARAYFRRLPFVITLLINGVAYSILILLGRALGEWSHGSGRFDLFPMDRAFYGAMAFALVLSIGLNFFLQMGQLIGQNVLWRFVRGRYHAPRAEFRFVMYLDMVGSTTIAERIGDAKFHTLLDDFFFDMTDALLECEGEIYKYVGDEVIVTWSEFAGARNANSARFVGLFRDAIAVGAGNYEARYGLVPEFRAGLHAGTMMIGELGEVRKEIVFLGDTMNTGARVLDWARELGVTLIVSEMAKLRFSMGDDLRWADLGERSLKGKDLPMRLYSPEFLPPAAD